MTLYVRNTSLILIGTPHKDPIAKPNVKTIQTQTFDDFLKNLTDNEKATLISVIESAYDLPWNGKVFAEGSTSAEYLKELVIPIIESGSIPNNLDFNEIIGKIGTPNREYLEEGLFHLIQDTIMQELNSN